MKQFLSALVIAAIIIGMHALAYLLSLVPIVTVILLAWVLGGIVLAILSELGVVKIDLSKVRN